MISTERPSENTGMLTQCERRKSISDVFDDVNHAFRDIFVEMPFVYEVVEDNTAQGLDSQSSLPGAVSSKPPEGPQLSLESQTTPDNPDLRGMECQTLDSSWVCDFETDTLSIDPVNEDSQRSTEDNSGHAEGAHLRTSLDSQRKVTSSKPSAALEDKVRAATELPPVQGSSFLSVSKQMFSALFAAPDSTWDSAECGSESFEMFCDGV